MNLNLDAWAWLPLADWNPDRLIAFHRVEGKRLCKVCDEWLSFDEEASHIKTHIRFERKRRAERAEANKEAGLEAARAARAEKKVQREAEQAIKKAEKAQQKAEKVAAKPVTVRKPRVKKAAVVLTIPDGEFTVNDVASSNGVERAVAFKVITAGVKAGEFISVGHVKSGVRGRPAVIYARKGAN